MPDIEQGTGVSLILFATSAGRLDQTLRSLEAIRPILRERNAEVIVAWGGRDPIPESVVSLHPVRVTILNLPGKNEPELIHTAAGEARGEWLLFLEEGVRVDPNFLGLHQANQNGRDQVVLGSVKTAVQREFNFFNNMSIGKSLWNRLSSGNTACHVNGVSRFAAFEAELRSQGVSIVRLESDLAWSTAHQGGGKRKLGTVAIWISDRCNLPCLMCRNSVELNRRARREWTLAELKRIIDDARSAGATCIELSEGEPTLWPHFHDILRYATQSGMEIGFVTNGTNITPSTAALIRESNVGDVPVSIDGPEEIHNRIRGRNSFQRTLRGIECFRNHGVEFSIFTVVSRWTIESLPDMVELARAVGAKQVSFQPVSRNQSGHDPRAEPLFFTDDDLPQIESQVQATIEMSRRLGVPIRSPMMLAAIPEYVRGGDTIVPRNGCTLPGRMAYIDRNRNLLTCFVSYETRLYQKYEPGMLAKILNSADYLKIIDRAEAGACIGCLANCSDLEACF